MTRSQSATSSTGQGRRRYSQGTDNNGSIKRKPRCAGLAQACDSACGEWSGKGDGIKLCGLESFLIAFVRFGLSCLAVLYMRTTWLWAFIFPQVLNYMLWDFFIFWFHENIKFQVNIFGLCCMYFQGFTLFSLPLYAVSCNFMQPL